MGRIRLGIWRKICRDDGIYVSIRKNLIGSRHFLKLALWAIMKTVNGAEFEHFKGSPTKLDAECFSRMHNAARLISEALRDVEFVANCSELEKDTEA